MGSRRVLGGLAAVLFATFAWTTPASAGEKEEVLGSASYPGMTTFSCRTNAIPIYPGQNLNDFGITKTCPNAEKLSGPGETSIFDQGSTAEGFITRFKPSMVEIKPNGKLVTPAVWDLHLHHVVWLAPGGGPTFASGEEKTIAKQPQGYGLKVDATANWGINQMIHNLGSSEGREVYLTWEIDWVPETTPARTDIEDTYVQWLDVAGAPQIYPVFDAERGFDTDGDGKYVFPDEVPTDPSVEGYEERENISNDRQWVVPAGGRTLVFGAGHLHPGGLQVDLMVARDGPDAGAVDGDTPAEVKNLFRSDARYYEPAGAVSWDVAMKATPRNWRISVKGGDTVFINTTYDVGKASWYESMGIMPLSVSTADDPMARDPFDDASEVEAMYDTGGVLTHRRLKENIDEKARKDLGLPNPRSLKSSKKEIPSAGVDVRGFYYGSGGYTATRGFPTNLMKPPVIKSGEAVTFINWDALPTMSQSQQAWHSVTSCRLPCNQGSGIGYPLASGPIKFDSGQLGYGTGTSAGVTTGSNVFTTPPLKAKKDAPKKGSTYAYFCRIHPAMRGSIRVKG